MQASVPRIMITGSYPLVMLALTLTDGRYYSHFFSRISHSEAA